LRVVRLDYLITHTHDKNRLKGQTTC